jgi:hypothetical protein
LVDGASEVEKGFGPQTLAGRITFLDYLSNEVAQYY